MVRPREGHDLHIESSILTIRPAHAVHWLRDVNATASRWSILPNGPTS